MPTLITADVDRYLKICEMLDVKRSWEFIRKELHISKNIVGQVKRHRESDPNFEFAEREKIKAAKRAKKSSTKKYQNSTSSVPNGTNLVPKNTNDPRDEITPFIKWIRTKEIDDYEGPQKSIVKRIKSHDRTTFIHGTIELWALYQKEKT